MTKGISYQIRDAENTYNPEGFKTKLFFYNCLNQGGTKQAETEEIEQQTPDDIKSTLPFYNYQDLSDTEEMSNYQDSSTTELYSYGGEVPRDKKNKARVVIAAVILIGSVVAVLLITWFFVFKSKTPEWQGDNFMIETIPGFRYRPNPPAAYTEGSLIAFNNRDYTIWTNIIDDFLEAYRYTKDTAHLYICDYDRPPNGDKVCNIEVKNWFPCTSERKFNYHKGAPCIFIKFNKIPNWTPEYYNDTKYLPEDMPVDLKHHITTQQQINPLLLNTVWVSCEGENAADKEFIGPIVYIPRRGFPGYFFPYTNQKGYLSPLVAVLYERSTRGVLVNVECRLWAPNIEYNREEGRGFVHFELMID